MTNFPDFVKNELERAREQNAPINSVHEGYGVILEEVDEFWAEVCKKKAERDPVNMFNELVQIAAMAQRVAEDVVVKMFMKGDGFRPC